MARLIAIGDIHGCSMALASVLDAIQPTTDDILVILGDMIDVGLDSNGVLDRLIELEGSCWLIPLLGNHEEMLLSARVARKSLEFWLNCGGVATLDSYGHGATLKTIPKRHWQFIEGCMPHFETDTHLFCHANYRPELPLSEQSGESLRWLSLMDCLPAPHCSGKVAVVGHTTQFTAEVLNLGHLICLDTFAHGSGWLTAMEVTTGQVWQADERGRLR